MGIQMRNIDSRIRRLLESTPLGRKVLETHAGLDGSAEKSPAIGKPLVPPQPLFSEEGRLDDLNERIARLEESAAREKIEFRRASGDVSDLLALTATGRRALARKQGNG